ncbi:hypothetical protein EV385_3699 [Krasilnikovia cinnamomea]|uniref:Secreted protein n=1 Tax=Krasilnikovia cinnamomea TaxID=349313 RepID=A0A4Q7ZN35_9ACTN|nr:hypothetical protein [Krasilnikovia cinnamomea]RZU51863.1 hypothetical protein EV385_3699 [Krasilnikovia cinnamomea]
MPDVLAEAPPPATQAETPRDRDNFRLAAFGALLVVVLFAGYGIGRLAGPSGSGSGTANGPATSAPAAQHPAGMPGTENAPHTHTAAAPNANPGEAVGGLAITASGLTLTPDLTTFPAGRSKPFRFRITASGGAPVTTYAVVHDKPLHLVVVRRDLAVYQHLHPTMAPDGTWTVDLDLAEPGSYRAIADFTAIVGGSQVPATLGVDVTVPGNYRPAALPPPAQTATTDRFTVSYEGTPQPGVAEPLLVSVTTFEGGPAALEPYLGAYGHLVVVREGDVGYVHVHPEPRLVDGKVKLWLAAPGPGRYRMFFDFQVAGRVHTAAWSVTVG